MSKQVKSFVRTIKSSYPVSPTADDFNKVYFLQKDANSTSGYIKTGGKDYGNGIVSAAYNSSTHKITFTLADGTSTSEIDCSSFLVDGMVEDVKLIIIVPFNSTTAYSAGDYVFRASDGKVYKFKVKHAAGAWNAEEVDEVPGVTAAGTYLFIDFNTASGKNDIWIDVKNIFNPANYYTKSEINAGFKPIQTRVEDPANSGQTSIEFISNIEQAVDGKIKPTKKTVAQVQPSTGGTGGYNGLMPAASAEKLNALPTNSQLNTALNNKADKVSGATSGNFAGLDSNGNLTDSGKNAANFATNTQGSKADSAIQSVKVNGTALTPDANKSVNIPAANSNTFGVSKLYFTEVDGSDSGFGSYSASYINSNLQKGIAIVDLD